jgi:hypothetical protein
MSQYQEGYYENENIENGHYEEPNYQQPSYDGESAQHDQPAGEGYTAGEDVTWNDQSRREAIISRKRARSEATKAAYELWDSQRDCK